MISQFETWWDEIMSACVAELVFAERVHVSLSPIADTYRVTLIGSDVADPPTGYVDCQTVAGDAIDTVLDEVARLDGLVYDRIFDRAVALSPMLGASRPRAGSGSPYDFRCFVCRKDPNASDMYGDVHDVELTGRVRFTRPRSKRERHRRGPRSSNLDRQYRCLSCGHVGWSNHSQLGKDPT